MDNQWETEIAELLGRLSDAQQQLLALLSKKGALLTSRDHQGLAALMPEEESLCNELQACYHRRQELLTAAEEAGLPSDSIQSLAGVLPSPAEEPLKKPLQESVERSRLLRHHSITQWVVVQRTLLHLSHMLEIIATGGQSEPTYGNRSTSISSGALIDRAA